jgi:hypothetical protein
MAYTLKTTGLATKLIACVAVDEDGTTVKDFVNGNTITHNADIANPKTGTATWKGTSRGWFKTDQGAEYYNPRGVTWQTTEVIPAAGFAFWCAVNSLTDTASAILWGQSGGNDNNYRTNASGQPLMRVGATDQTASTQALAAGTKLSIGMNFKNNASGQAHFHGLESGDLSQINTFAVDDWMTNFNLGEFGGISGQASMRGQYFIACWFSDTDGLTESEFDSLHDDWFNTLFEAPITGTIAAILNNDFLSANGTVGSAPKRAVFSVAAGNELRDSNQALVTQSSVPYAIYKASNLTNLGSVIETGTANISSGAATINIGSASIVLGDTVTVLFDDGTNRATPTLVTT